MANTISKSDNYLRFRGFVPAAISGFFSPVITDSYFTTGAKGGGVTIDRGVWVDVIVRENSGLEVLTFLNGKLILNSIAEYVVKQILRDDANYKIVIRLNTEVPVSSGYGTSAASAYAAAMAINHLFKLNLPFDYLMFIAHKADIVFKTGLGSVCGYVSPGFVLIKRAGAPHLAKIINLDYDDDIIVFTAWRNGVDKRRILGNSKRLEDIAKIGDKTLDKILSNPSLPNFFRRCWEFTIKAGFVTPWVKRVVSKLNNLDGVIGVAQTQIGEAIFGAVKRESLYNIERVLDRVSFGNYLIANVYRELPLTKKLVAVEVV